MVSRAPPKPPAAETAAAEAAAAAEHSAAVAAEQAAERIAQQHAAGDAGRRLHRALQEAAALRGRGRRAPGAALRRRAAARARRAGAAARNPAAARRSARHRRAAGPAAARTGRRTGCGRDCRGSCLRLRLAAALGLLLQLRDALGGRFERLLLHEHRLRHHITGGGRGAHGVVDESSPPLCPSGHWTAPRMRSNRPESICRSSGVIGISHFGGRKRPRARHMGGFIPPPSVGGITTRSCAMRSRKLYSRAHFA